jgi:hypothetical protein
MSHSEADRFTDAVTLSDPAGPSLLPSQGGGHPLVHDGAVSEDARNAHPDPTTTLATTLAKEGRRPLVTRSGASHASPMTSERGQISVDMTATLSAELGTQVPQDLIADIVRAVLDEGRQDAQGWVLESTILEARRRLERFIRARSSTGPR